MKEIMRPTESAITEAPKTKVVADDLASIRKMEKLHEERIQVNISYLPTASASKEETHSSSATEVVNPLLSSYCVSWQEGIMISESDEAASLAFVFSCPRVSHLRHPVGERNGGGNRVVRGVASGRGDEPEDVASVDAGRDCDRYGIVLVSSDHHHIITSSTHRLINSYLVNSFLTSHQHHINSPNYITHSPLSDTRYYPITNLYPSTTYDVTCFGYSGSTYMTENPFMIRQSVMTKDKVFSIKEAQFNNGFIEVSLDSNLEIAVLCFLFNSKNIKIDNKLYDASQDTSILFEVPQTTTQYRVQCSALNDKNKGGGLLG